MFLTMLIWLCYIGPYDNDNDNDNENNFIAM